MTKKPFVIYRNGLHIDGVKCSRCGRKRSGIVMQNRIRWVIYLDCGHLAMRGSVLPLETLEKMKLANQKQSADPRLKWRIDHEMDLKQRAELDALKQKFVQTNLTRGRRFL